MSLLPELFSLLCGQEHSWIVGGGALPFCQRCTGLYVGAVPALLVYLWFRPKATSELLWVHGMCLLQMVPFGYHLIAQSGELRMLTGQLFAVGLVYYLTLLLADRWPPRQELSRSGIAGYFLSATATLFLLQAAVSLGGSRTNKVLSWVGMIGLLIYGLLVSVNLLALAIAALRVLFRRTLYSET